MGKLSFIAGLFIFLGATSAKAMDHRSQFGAGGGLGANFAAPWTASEFRSAVGPKFPALSVWGRYIPGTPEIGVELSYNYIGLSQMGFHAHTAVASFISRQNPWGNFHPFYGVGFGYARAVNKFASNWDDPIAKLTLGIEFEMNERTDLGFRLDHYTIFRDTNDQRTMHMLTPTVSVNYYFGTPAALPTTPSATPVPVPNAPAPAPAQTVTPRPDTPVAKEAPEAAAPTAEKPTTTKTSRAARGTKKKKPARHHPAPPASNSTP